MSATNEPGPGWLQEINRTYAVSDEDVPMLEAAYAAGRAARWVYVEDGLPEEDCPEAEEEGYAVADEGEGVSKRAWYYPDKGCWFDHDGRVLRNVYAWAPLDELPPRREG